MIDEAEQPESAPGKFFKCAICGRVFVSGRSDEEARAEANEKDLDISDCEEVCEECYKMAPWGRE